MPDRSEYVYSSDGFLRKRRDEDSQNAPYPSHQVSPADSWTRATSEHSYTTDTRNWIELTSPEDSIAFSTPNINPSSINQSPVNPSPSTSIHLTNPSNPTLDNATDILYPDLQPTAVEDPSTFLTQDFFNDICALTPSQEQDMPPPPSPAAPLPPPNPAANSASRRTPFTLTAAERLALYKIAMPDGPPISTTSLSETALRSPTSPAESRGSRKRKAEGEGDEWLLGMVGEKDGEDGEDEEEEGNKGGDRKGKARVVGREGVGMGDRKRRDHNAIEKKYRDNINGKFAELRSCVPSLRAGESSRSRTSRSDGGGEDAVMGGNRDVDGEGEGEDEEGGDELDGLQPAHKFNKATIIVKAIEYIRHLETKERRARRETVLLKERVAAFEQLMGFPGATWHGNTQHEKGKKE